MSKLIELMEQLNQEEELQLTEMKKDFEEQDQKHKKIKDALDFYNDETQKHMDSCMKNLDKLISNKHTIVKALKQTESLTGLPITQEQHSSVVDLIGKMTTFISNINNVINRTNVTCPDNIYKNVVNIMEITESDLKVNHTEGTEIKDLLHNTKSLVELLNTSNEDEDQNLSITITE